MTFRKMTLVATLAAMAALQAGANMARAEATAGQTPGRITITGTGRADVAPDMATITLGVTTQAATAAEALSVNSSQLSTVLERLKAQGIEARDLQTTGLNLGPRQEYSNDGKPPKLLGYEAANMLTVRVRDLGKLGGVLDSAVGDGANAFHGLVFTLTEPEPALDEARAKAVADARRKAEQIAGAAGVKLGRILEMEEGGSVPSPRMLRTAEMAVAASAPVEGGEVSYFSSVTISWELVAQ